MMHNLAIVVAGVLLALSGIHIAWAIGAKRPPVAAIPTENGRPLFVPGRMITLAVAVALGLAAYVALAAANVAPAWSLSPQPHDLCLTAALVFIVRAIGDFKYVGAFKSVRETKYAHFDTWAYSPLSVAIGAAFFLLSIL